MNCSCNERTNATTKRAAILSRARLSSPKLFEKNIGWELNDRGAMVIAIEQKPAGDGSSSSLFMHVHKKNWWCGGCSPGLERIVVCSSLPSSSSCVYVCGYPAPSSIALVIAWMGGPLAWEEEWNQLLLGKVTLKKGGNLRERMTHAQGREPEPFPGCLHTHKSASWWRVMPPSRCRKWDYRDYVTLPQLCALDPTSSPFLHVLAEVHRSFRSPDCDRIQPNIRSKIALHPPPPPTVYVFSGLYVLITTAGATSVWRRLFSFP